MHSFSMRFYRPVILALRSTKTYHFITILVCSQLSIHILLNHIASKEISITLISIGFLQGLIESDIRSSNRVNCERLIHDSII